MLRRIIAIILALALAAFFAFVGWNKAFAPLTDLARHHAWTIYLPDTLGRIVGWSEMVLAAGLLGALMRQGWRVARFSALLLVLNQLLAAGVHAFHGEAGALPQNGVLVAALLAVTLLLPRAKVQTKEMD